MLYQWFIPMLLQAQDVFPEAAAPGFLDRLTRAFSVVSINNFLFLSALLFTIGVAGVLTRRNIIVILMSIELILNAANLNLVAFSRYWQIQGGISPYTGQLFTIFIIVVAAAEAVIGLGILIALYRNRETVSVDEIDILKL